MSRLISVFLIAVYLSACQSTVNGVNPAQEDSTFCGRNLGLCIVGGALAVGGIAAAASSGYHKKAGVTYTGPGGTMTTGGTTGGTTTTGVYTP